MGSILCTTGCLAASSAFTHQLPRAPVPCPRRDNQNCLQTLPEAQWGAKPPTVENQSQAVPGYPPKMERLLASNPQVESLFFKKKKTTYLLIYLGFPGGSDSKESACNAGDMGLIPESGRSLGEGNGCPLRYSCLVNSMDRGAWRVIQSTGSQRVRHD